jgi:hypothetical protein
MVCCSPAVWRSVLVDLAWKTTVRECKSELKAGSTCTYVFTMFFSRACTRTCYIKKEDSLFTRARSRPSGEQGDYIGFNCDWVTNPARHHNSSLPNTESATAVGAQDKLQKAWSFLCNRITHTTASTSESKALRRLLDTCLRTLVH